MPCSATLSIAPACNGELSIPELHNQNIPLDIQAGKDSDLSAFRSTLTCLRDNIAEIKQQIADESFETYEIHVREDRKTGNFTTVSKPGAFSFGLASEDRLLTGHC